MPELSYLEFLTNELSATVLQASGLYRGIHTMTDRIERKVEKRRNQGDHRFNFFLRKHRRRMRILKGLRKRSIKLDKRAEILALLIDNIQPQEKSLERIQNFVMLNRRWVEKLSRLNRKMKRKYEQQMSE